MMAGVLTVYRLIDHMKYTEQDLKDEHEQAVKRGGEKYANGYIEGLEDAQHALTISLVMQQSELLKAFLKWRLDKPHSDFQTQEYDIEEFLIDHMK